MTKRFQPESQKIVTVTIEPDGNLTFLATDAADIFLELGHTVTRRASHVEPATFWARQAFTVLRWFGNKNRIAEWTRGWSCLWRINTRPVGGPVLTWGDIWRAEGTTEEFPVAYSLSGFNAVARFKNRQNAIDREINFLNNWFSQRRIG